MLADCRVSLPPLLSLPAVHDLPPFCSGQQGDGESGGGGGGSDLSSILGISNSSGGGGGGSVSLGGGGGGGGNPLNEKLRILTDGVSLLLRMGAVNFPFTNMQFV